VAQQNRKYRTTITVKTVVESGGAADNDEKFFEANLTYHGLSNEGLSMVEGEMISLQQRLRDKGDEITQALHAKKH
jgi:hypothetical protein